ncbi:ROK family transcriptional regulator [Ruania halotolerans]|uniref:ROK family transcriptional regulator n=1 Tax=Ruania halotolerans TaxID=2897773 RepID=UPI001E3AAF5D|nr:ROK family transcriptional regulator [Ruania halotolerans]UFU07704.1 ROK family transcriptional regulator [Ruania halotolerans]
MQQPTSISAPSRAAGVGALLQLLRDGGPRTRADLVNETGMGRSTVTLRLDALLRTGLVRAEAGSSTGGRPPTAVRFEPSARTVLAVDVGAAHLAIAVTDLSGTVLAEHREPIAIDEGPQAVLERVRRAGTTLLTDLAPHPPLAGVGVGLPGPVEHATGRPRTPPIMPGWDGADVAGILGATFDVPVLVDNDVDLMALGEHAEVYPEIEHLMFVTIATGIGAGIIAGGSLVRGADGAAGDLGHIAVPGGAPVPCTCGNTGCLEALASGPALIHALRAAQRPVSTAEDVLALVADGDVEAAERMRLAGQNLGAVLAGCVNLLNPSVIVIGGPFAAAGSPLFTGIEQVVRARSLPLATARLRVVPSRTEGRAGLLGAARAVADHVLAPVAVEAMPEV